MSIGLVLFLSAVAIGVIAVICGAAVALERYFPSKNYDERQQVARGNAYRVTFWVGFVYYLVLLPYLIMGTYQDWLVEPYLLVTIGFLIQMVTFHIYCLMTHSALPLGGKPMSTIVAYSLMGGSYMIQFFAYKYEGSTVGFSGYESTDGLRLMLSVGFLTLAIVHLIAHLRKAKE